MSWYRRVRIKNGTYFFTINLADRSSTLLVDQVDLLRRAYARIQERLSFETVAICIMPDHVHAIWTLPESDDDFPMRWNLIKSGFSRALPAAPNRSASNSARREKGIWQRRYWEHVIRDEEDLVRHINYIHYNPVKHGHATRVVDWPYSSFHRYVARGDLPADWGGDVSEMAGDFGE
jgi:putative transposase